MMYFMRVVIYSVTENNTLIRVVIDFLNMSAKFYVNKCVL